MDPHRTLVVAQESQHVREWEATAGVGQMVDQSPWIIQTINLTLLNTRAD